MHSVFEITEESTDPASVDLVSLEDLKLALGITTNTDDEALQAAITFQSQIISEYCDRRLAFAEALETFTFDRNETMLTRQALWLSLYPVVDIFEVSSMGATDPDYDLDPTSGRLWTDGPQDIIAVTYSGGYNLPDEAPARLQKAVILAVNEGRTSGARDSTIQEVQHGDTRIRYFTPTLATASSGFLSAPIVELIKPYRRLHVA